MPQYPPIVPAMRHVHTERAAQARLLIGPLCGIVLDQSRRKCLGTPLPSVRGDGEQNRSPGGAANDPAECQICRGHRIPIGQELNMTDTEQQ